MEKQLTYGELAARIAVLESSLSAKDATIAELDSQIARKEERTAYLERLLSGSKSDKMDSKAAASDRPGLFDELSNGAYDGRTAQIRQKAGEIRAEADNRRKAARAKPAVRQNTSTTAWRNTATRLIPTGWRPGSSTGLEKTRHVSFTTVRPRYR